MNPIDVIGGIRLAANDCRAQNNHVAANELLDVLGAARAQRDALAACVTGLRECAKQHRLQGDSGHARVADLLAEGAEAILEATKEA